MEKKLTAKELVKITQKTISNLEVVFCVEGYQFASIEYDKVKVN